MTTVSFERSDLDAIRRAHQALNLIGDFTDDQEGYRGAAIGIALDDLTLLEDRMQDALDKETSNVVGLRGWLGHTGKPW
jgi:hypothetical protein